MGVLECLVLKMCRLTAKLSGDPTGCEALYELEGGLCCVKPAQLQ